MPINSRLANTAILKTLRIRAYQVKGITVAVPFSCRGITTMVR
jgi:hypothetical protein